MHLYAVWKFLEQEIFPLRSIGVEKFPIFNPYQEVDHDIDLSNAAHIRRNNIKCYFDSFPRKPAVLVLGEAPGWRGCRFSGVPFTSESQLIMETHPFRGSPSSKRVPPYSESTATIFWETMREYHPDFIAWNCVPFHPHCPRNRLSNRTLSASEIRKYQPLLSQMIRALNPCKIIAVGKQARRALSKSGYDSIPVRHPSHGGAKEFRQGIEGAFGIKTN